MRYTLITPKGKVYTFLLRAVAIQYKDAYGGVLFSDNIVVDFSNV